RAAICARRAPSREKASTSRGSFPRSRRRWRAALLQVAMDAQGDERRAGKIDPLLEQRARRIERDRAACERGLEGHGIGEPLLDAQERPVASGNEGAPPWVRAIGQEIGAGDTLGS